MSSCESWNVLEVQTLKHTFTSMCVPIKQQSQASEQQRVKNMIDDLRLLSYSSIFKSEVGCHWLTTVWK